MSWSISKGETFKIEEGKYLKFTGATVHRWYVTASFLFKNDLVEKIIVLHIDNRDCMYIGDVLHFSSLDKEHEILNEIYNEIT